jgi:hypothetical protein
MALLSLLHPRPPSFPPLVTRATATMATPTPRKKGKEKEGVASAPDRRTTAGRTDNNPNRRLKKIKNNHSHRTTTTTTKYFFFRTKKKHFKIAKGKTDIVLLLFPLSFLIHFL